MRQVVTVMSSRISFTTLILRIATALVLIDAGYLKIFKGDLARGTMGKYGVPLPEIVGPFISFLEFFGGIALLIGFFTRYLGLIFTIEFVVAALLKMKLGIDWPNYSTMWIDLMLIGANLMLASAGAGMLSADRGRRWDV